MEAVEQVTSKPQKGGNTLNIVGNHLENRMERRIAR